MACTCFSAVAATLDGVTGTGVSTSGTRTAGTGASAPAWAVEAFTAQYSASALGMVGEGQMSVTPQSGNRWQYALTVRNQAVDLSQKTVFDVQEGRMRPLSSSDSSRLLIKKKNVNTVYDWGKAQATWNGDVKPDRAGPPILLCEPIAK